MSMSIIISLCVTSSDIELSRETIKALKVFCLCQAVLATILKVKVRT
jgi:hypothetical protein